MRVIRGAGARGKRHRRRTQPSAPYGPRFTSPSSAFQTLPIPDPAGLPLQPAAPDDRSARADGTWHLTDLIVSADFRDDAQLAR